MEPDTALPDGGSTTENGARQKRSRVLLSCGPCRHSKLKCDREQPCSQCVKKDRVDLCTYAPKPERRRPAKGVTARLRRLEGMVREMMDNDNNTTRSGPEPSHSQFASKDGEPPAISPTVRGNVVQGQNTTTYIGATHCMAMLEDVGTRAIFEYSA
jgi:hypothetical protein